MYLKALYIQGFKSFANKTKIDFNNRITGIVGPNGSGKSNISDAIMWVLGETSVKTLRGSKMEDVIFSGSDNRKPLGFAEVTIVFDNSDRTLPLEFNEISVTRRMYRSLESEFSINNTRCRLKDIKELFMDTGIGKDGYSLIGQGKIESILSSKPEQRRAIFEEAAGISKFKMKKRDSERKLEKTKENLIRLNDIISEIEKRKDLLEEQSKDAIKYKKIFNELKNLEITIGAYDISKKSDQIKDLEGKISELKKIKLKNDEKLITNSNLRNQIEKILSVTEDELNIKQEEQVNKSKILENKNSKVELFELEIENFTKNINDKDIQISEYRKEIENLNNSIIEVNQNIEINSISLNELRNKEINFQKILLEKSADLKSAEDNRNTDNALYLEIYNNITSLKSKIEMKESLLKEKNNRIDSIDANLEILINNNRELDLSINNTNSELKEFENINNELLDKKTIDSNYLKELERIFDKLTDEMYTLKNSFEEKSAKYRALKNLTENYEGFNKSVKSFMNMSNKRGLFKNSLIGPVADKIIIDGKYEKAISVALGSSIQNIIIEREKDAKDMIELLTSEKLGRVTFLPLDNLNYTLPKINPKKFNEKVLGFADSLVSYEKHYEDVFKSLLGKVIVTEDFETGVDVSNKLNKSYRVVTLDGDVFNAGGSITGGSIYKGNISILSRSSELKSLSEDVEDTKIRYNDRLKEYNEKKLKIESLKFNINKTSNEIEDMSRKIFNLKNSIENLNSSKNNNKIYIEKYQNEKNSYKNSIEEDYDLIGKLKEQKNKLSNEIENIIEKNSNSDNVLNCLKESIEELKKDLSDIKVEIAKIDSELKSNIKNINGINEDIKRYNEKIVTAEEEIKEYQSKRLYAEEQLNNLKLEIKEYKIEFEKLLSEISELRNTRKAKNDENVNLQKNSNSLIEEINNIQREIDKRIYNIEKLNMEILNISDILYKEYKIEKKDIVKSIEISNMDESKNKVLILKKEIEELDEVNILAIEEYEAVKERFEFNITQKKDLLDSIDEIKNILVELDKEMNKLFKESFRMISIYFDDIFKKLFNGGAAQIEIDGSDPLNDGIEIKAQPPGKRFQNLSLLSGGERALTAVALLFALLKVRPAPFCILDEIDAALDDANIRRYTDYLLTLEDIQFIIITHRKSTMEIANKLYGVTMEEKGISKLISVELNQ